MGKAMSRHFTLRKMLRMTPNRFLQEFFQRLGHLPPCLDWRKVHERNVDPLLLSLGLLPPEAQVEIESALASVFELACETGWRAILEVARLDGKADQFLQLPDHACPYKRAMWTWLHQPHIFEQASIIHQVEHLTRWRKRTGLPRVVPQVTPESIQELARSLTQCLTREEGRGQNCTVEYFRRRDSADVFVAYPDDFVHTISMHDEAGSLVPSSVRPTFEIVFAYNAEEGTLELFAKVAPLLKPKLECLFGQVILRTDIGLRGAGRPYDLNQLKDRYFCLETDATDRVSASITKLRLDVPQLGWLTVEPAQSGRGSDVYEVIDECLNDQAVCWDDVNISQATFRFQFQPLVGRQPGTLSFDVTYPDHCSIRSRRPERLELMRKYLRRWRIARV